MPSIADTVALESLLARYGHIMDSEDFERLAEVLTEDVRWDSSAMPTPFVNVGLKNVVAKQKQAIHPRSYHATNVIVAFVDEDAAVVYSKSLTIQENGTVRTGDYFDHAIRTENGWRIDRHKLLARRF
jgi:SnoaL-like domain